MVEAITRNEVLKSRQDFSPIKIGILKCSGMTNNHCVHKAELHSFGVKRCLFQAAIQPNFSPKLLY